MRRALVLAAMAALFIGSIPSIAGAARATRETEDRLELACLSVSEEGTLYVVVGISNEFGTQAAAYWWAPGDEPLADSPTLASREYTVDGAIDSTAVMATMQLYEVVEPDPDDPDPDPYGKPAGEAIVSASLSPDGAPEVVVDESQNTNAKFRASYQTQAFSVSGSITLPDATYDTADICVARRQHVEFFSTNPDTVVERSSGIGLACTWDDEDRQVFLNATHDEVFGAYVEVFVSDISGDYAGFSTDPELDTDSFAADFELLSSVEELPAEEQVGTMAIGGEPSGSVSARATLTPTGDSGRFFDRSHGQMVKFFYEDFAVIGELTLTTDAGTVVLAMDGACSANSADTSFRFSSPNGPKGPTGRSLANDFPDNADPIAVGDTIGVNTRGTQTEPEAGCVISTPEGEGEVPLAHTAWWLFGGTGEEVTFDTAGSDFDTVIGVYRATEEGFAQVGCVDDVSIGAEDMSLQAAITIATEDDVSYYVQVGGIGDQTGNLSLAAQ